MGSDKGRVAVYVIHVVGPGGFTYEVPEAEFPATPDGQGDAVDAARRLVDHLVNGSDRYLGAPVVVDDVLDTLEDGGVSPDDCGVAVVLCACSGGRTSLRGQTVYAERVVPAPSPGVVRGKRMVEAVAV